MDSSSLPFAPGGALRTCFLTALSALLPVNTPAMPSTPLSLPSAAAPGGAAQRPPNFVVIYADDLGFGDLGCYGDAGIATPRLDALARDGVRFTNLYATAATCTPSRYSLLTGSYPWRNPRAKILRGDAPMIIGPQETTLPGVLRRAGYSTAVVGKWHIGLGDGSIDWNGEIRPSPVDVGFDESFVMAATNDRVPSVYVKDRRVHNLDPADPLEVVYAEDNPFPEVPTGRSHPHLLSLKHSDEQHFDTIVNGVGRIGFARGGKAATWDDTTMVDVFLGRAKDFITRKRDKPFFLYLAAHQPHVPRIPSERFRGKSTRGARGDVILELDWMVGEIIDHLEAQGLGRDTIVLFSSDNGPVLIDGYLDQADELAAGRNPAGPLRGGKYSLFDGGTRVPGIVWAPGRAKPGVSEALLSHVDLLASFSALAGAPLAPEELADSEDHASALLGHTAGARQHLVTEGFSAKTLVREGSWVYIPAYPGPALFGGKNIESGNSTEPQLYNLDDDIGQRSNLAREQPERVKALAALLEDLRAKRRR